MTVSNEQLYKSMNETYEHIKLVQHFMDNLIVTLLIMKKHHDQSKLEEPEVEKFAEITEKMKDIEYGSKEYEQCKQEINDAIQHHYQHNSHHPEHFKNGIDDMDLLDLIEMICDWKVAGYRNKNGSIEKSIEFCSEKYNISPQLKQILYNTVESL